MFSRFGYEPEKRGSHSVLERRIGEFITRSEHEELLRRIERLEKGETG